MLLYNVLAYSRYKLPVQSVIILLRKEADGPAMSGKIGYEVPQSQAGSLALRYRVVRVWEKAVEEVLQGGLAALPLAPLANVSENELPAIVKQKEDISLASRHVLGKCLRSYQAGGGICLLPCLLWEGRSTFRRSRRRGI
jgi:hypothetical protein